MINIQHRLTGDEDMLGQHLAMHLAALLRKEGSYGFAQTLGPIGADVQWADPVTGSSKMVACM